MVWLKKQHTYFSLKCVVWMVYSSLRSLCHKNQTKYQKQRRKGQHREVCKNPKWMLQATVCCFPDSPWDLFTDFLFSQKTPNCFIPLWIGQSPQKETTCSHPSIVSQKRKTVLTLTEQRKTNGCQQTWSFAHWPLKVCTFTLFCDCLPLIRNFVLGTLAKESIVVLHVMTTHYIVTCAQYPFICQRLHICSKLLVCVFSIDQFSTFCSDSIVFLLISHSLSLTAHVISCSMRTRTQHNWIAFLTFHWPN